MEVYVYHTWFSNLINSDNSAINSRWNVYNWLRFLVYKSMFYFDYLIFMDWEEWTVKESLALTLTDSMKAYFEPDPVGLKV